MSLFSSSLVALLNDDVLAYIFHLNTHTRETELCWSRVLEKNESVLVTARHTSQVCRSWRQLIIQSPTIWANIIDLRALAWRPASTLWISEVLRRTGEVNLSIFGPVSLLAQTPQTFIISLLEENWHRVRQLNLSMIGPGYVDQRLCDVFWTRPAPNLERFIVRGGNPSALKTIRKDGLMLFSGYAPRLRHILVPRLQFGRGDLWLPQLLSVTLTNTLTLTATLDVLSRCSRLESLTIMLRDDDGVKEMRWTQEVHLPHLRLLSISCSPLKSLILLSAIIPRTDCALALSTSEAKLQTIETFQRLLKIVSRYSKAYFDTYSPPELIVDIMDTHIQISSKAPRKAVSFPHPGFKICIGGEFPVLKADFKIVDNLFSTLATVNLKTIDEFRLQLCFTAWHPARGNAIQVLQSLTSVTKMTLTPAAIRVLNDLSTSASLLPSLVEVTVIMDEEERDYIALHGGLRIFLSLRIEDGSPVKTLYITSTLDSWGRSKDWSFLQEFDDLRCFYKYSTGERVEYLSGPTESDPPDREFCCSRGEFL